MLIILPLNANFRTVGGIPGAQPLLLIGIILAGASTLLHPESRDDNFGIDKKLKKMSEQIKSLEVKLNFHSTPIWKR